MAPTGISDPILNCILEVCCGAAEAEDRLAEQLLVDGICEHKAHAKKCAAYMFKYFDLAPVGSLGKLKRDIAQLAKGESGAARVE